MADVVFSSHFEPQVPVKRSSVLSHQFKLSLLEIMGFWSAPPPSYLGQRTTKRYSTQYHSLDLIWKHQRADQLIHGGGGYLPLRRRSPPLWLRRPGALWNFPGAAARDLSSHRVWEFPASFRSDCSSHIYHNNMEIFLGKCVPSHCSESG